jgi:hypothetical protein
MREAVTLGSPRATPARTASEGVGSVAQPSGQPIPVDIELPEVVPKPSAPPLPIAGSSSTDAALAGSPADDSQRSMTSSIANWFTRSQDQTQGSSGAPAAAAEDNDTNRSDISQVFMTIVSALSPKPSARDAAVTTSTTANDGFV